MKPRAWFRPWRLWSVQFEAEGEIITTIGSHSLEEALEYAKSEWAAEMTLRGLL